MGITIHYQGTLNSTDLIDPFCEEVEDISRSMEWEYTIIEEKNRDNMWSKGLIIKPHPSAEFLQFVVDKKGNLRNSFLLEFSSDDSKSSYFNHIKTQFAPLEVHITIIKLLKYLQQNYISNLIVYDEGDYWQTGNELILKEKMDFLNAKMDLMEDILSSTEFTEKDNSASVADKIEEVLKKLRNKN